MKRNTIIALAAALLPLAGHAEEKPLWEVRGRLDGGDHPRLSLWTKDLFPRDGTAAMIGEKAVFRIAGFDNDATPEGDWVAEVRDLADPAGVMKGIEAEAKPDGQGRLLIKKEDAAFLVWLDGDSRLQLAGPPQNAGVTVAPAAPLKADAWVSGWVDLSRIAELGELESTALKLPESLSFTASGAGDGIVIHLSAGLESKEVADTSMAFLVHLKEELAADKEAAAKVPPVEITAEDKKLTVRIELTGAHLDDLIEEVKKAIEDR